MKHELQMSHQMMRETKARDVGHGHKQERGVGDGAASITASLSHLNREGSGATTKRHTIHRFSNLRIFRNLSRTLGTSDSEKHVYLFWQRDEGWTVASFKPRFPVTRLVLRFPDPLLSRLLFLHSGIQ